MFSKLNIVGNFPLRRLHTYANCKITERNTLPPQPDPKGIPDTVRLLFIQYPRKESLKYHQGISMAFKNSLYADVVTTQQKGQELLNNDLKLLMLNPQ